jgi:hypothetical protein
MFIRLCSKIGQDKERHRAIFIGLILVFYGHSLASEHREKGYMYLSPVPRAEYVSSQTRYFLVRFETISPHDITNLTTFITVTGQSSGLHPGQTKIATDNRTVIFQASSTFTSNELVTVTLAPTVDPCAPGTVEPYQYQFMIAGRMPSPLSAPASELPTLPSSESPAGEQVKNTQVVPQTEYGEIPAANMTVTAENAVPGEAGIMPNGVSVPSDFPHINITINNNPDSGYIFLDNRGGGGVPYNVIFDNTGSPIWYRRMPDERRDMKVQRNGVLTMLARTGGYRYVGLDTTYQEIATYQAVNGYSTDEHELVVLENGYYLLIGLRSQTVDMSQYVSGGNPNASVGETIIQEFTPAGELIFQWRAWDNFDVRDVELDDVRGGSFRFPHMNAIDIDEDGHIILSSRHLSEITKINRNTGEIIWRLSGIPKNNYFTFVNDPLNGPRNQHAVRYTGNGRYLMFDNGNLHSPSVSRGVEYELNLEHMTATLVWQFRETPDVFSHYMGNTQRLPNSNTLINWAVGNLPKLTEVRPNGTKAFEMNWVDQWEAYRVWRCQWQGNAAQPYLIIEPQSDNLTLIFNKFGDPNVAYYRIYGGTSPQPTALLDTSSDTLKRLTDLEDGVRYYFRVTAVDTNGAESIYSNEESAIGVSSSAEPGRNMVLNGDFCQGQDSWELVGSAYAQWSIENGVSHFHVSAAGRPYSDVQFKQTGMRLAQGIGYVLEFDARAQPAGIIEVKVEQDESPWTDYSKMGYTYITTKNKHFRHPFIMEKASDFEARLVFNMGGANFDVYLDNISLMAVPLADFDFDCGVGLSDLALLVDDWLEAQSSLRLDLQRNGRVDFGDFVSFTNKFGKLCSITLVTEKDAKRVLVPTSNIGYTWIGNAEPYNDTGWAQVAKSDCPAGVGYENKPGDPINYVNLIGYDVKAQMSGIMTSCYIRIPFTLNVEPSLLNHITLKIRYDDGFVAYINGEYLTRDNINAEVPTWNDDADELHDDTDAVILQPFRVTRGDNPDVFNALHLGNNVLAIHGLNDSTGSSDFLISAELHTGN